MHRNSFLGVLDTDVFINFDLNDDLRSDVIHIFLSVKISYNDGSEFYKIGGTNRSLRHLMMTDRLLRLFIIQY